MFHIPGVRHRATNCLSRHPTGAPERLYLPDDIATISSIPATFLHSPSLMAGLRTLAPHEDTIEVCTISSAMCALESLHLESFTWDRVRTATASDDNMQALLGTVEAGMPEFRHELPPPLREYFQFRDELSTVDGVILYKDRLVIPPSLREEVLAHLHAAHQGVTSMTARAESSIFWPGISPAIAALRARCNQCNRIAPSNPSAPPTPLLSPAYPFQCVCADFFHYKGCNYLVVVDRYSNWPIVERSTQGATGLISCLRRIFVTKGIQDELASDGGPEFTAVTTRRFLQDWGIHHRLSSVVYPHSNCRAEVAVKSVKRLIMSTSSPTGALDTDAFQRAMLQYRNTPDRDTKLSPAMCVFGRPIQDFIPIAPGKYIPHNTWRETLAAREDALRNRHMRGAERWSEYINDSCPLPLVTTSAFKIRQVSIHSSGTKLGSWSRFGNMTNTSFALMVLGESDYATGNSCGSTFLFNNLYLQRRWRTTSMLVADRHPCLSLTMQDWHHVRLAPLALLTFLTATQCRLPTRLCHPSWTMMVLATGVPLSLRLSPLLCMTHQRRHRPTWHPLQSLARFRILHPSLHLRLSLLLQHRDALPVAPSSLLGALTILCDLSIRTDNVFRVPMFMFLRMFDFDTWIFIVLFTRFVVHASCLLFTALFRIVQSLSHY